MNVALLPAKHVRLDECILGLGGQVLRHLGRPRSVDSLIRSINANRDERELPAADDDLMMLVVAFLFAIDAISFDDDGRLVRNAID